MAFIFLVIQSVRILMKYFALVFLVCALAAFSWPTTDTNRPDEDAVRAVLELYFDGYTRGDTETLSQAFHPDSHIKYITGRGQYANWTRAEFFNVFDENWNYTITSQIYDIDVTGTAAGAKVSVTLEGIITWTDYVNLLKIDDRWQIVHKISHGTRP